MNHPRLLIAGVGNIFLGDDAFGVEVAQRLLARSLPDEVRVVDFGIRGLDLTYALLEDYDAVILLDATPQGHPPGTLYVIEPEPEDVETEPDTAPIEMHGMNPVMVLRAARRLGAGAKRMLLVGCEPSPPGREEETPLGLSGPVRATVNEAVPLVESLAAKLLAELPALVGG